MIVPEKIQPGVKDCIESNNVDEYDPRDFKNDLSWIYDNFDDDGTPLPDPQTPEQNWQNIFPIYKDLEKLKKENKKIDWQDGEVN